MKARNRYPSYYTWGFYGRGHCDKYSNPLPNIQNTPVTSSHFHSLLEKRHFRPFLNGGSLGMCYFWRIAVNIIEASKIRYKVWRLTTAGSRDHTRRLCARCKNRGWNANTKPRRWKPVKTCLQLVTSITAINIYDQTQHTNGALQGVEVTA